MDGVGDRLAVRALRRRRAARPRPIECNLGAPARAPRVEACVEGVPAAAAGAIGGAAFVLGRRAPVAVPAVLLAVAALVLLPRVKGVSEPIVILGAGLLGIAVTAIAP